MNPVGWPAIVRLGVVNGCLGMVVALVTFTLNRVMTVELAFPAIVPGALVGLHYAVQLLRPRFGFGSDSGGRRTPWIIGGLAALSAGGVLAAASVWLMEGHLVPGLALAVLAYALVGLGVGAVGTSSLALMAVRVAPARRPAAATVFWLLMIVGAVVAAGTALAPPCTRSPWRCCCASPLASPAPPSWPAPPPSGAWNAAAPPQSRAKHAAEPPLRHPTPAASPRHWRRPGASRRRAASPSSSSSPCWPTARRNSSSSRSPAWCSPFALTRPRR